MTLTSSENPAAYGEQVILTATVLPTPAATAVPTGSVTFTDSGQSLGTVPLSSTGQAALPESALPTGADLIQAQYSGSTVFAPADSATLDQAITVQGSTTLVFPAVDPATYGQTLVFVVSVAPVAGTGVPTGTVTLLDGPAPVGSAPLDGGTAAVAIPTLDAGTHLVTAEYSGDGNFSASASAPSSEAVEPASTATSLTLSPSSADRGQQVTLTASVTSPTALVEGQVTFWDGDATLGTSELSGGTATLVTSFDRPGEHRLTADFPGGGNYTASTSDTAAIRIQGGPGCDDDHAAPNCPDTLAVSLPTGDPVGVRLPEVAPLRLDAQMADGPLQPEAPLLVTVAAAPASVDAGQSVTLTSVVFGRSGASYPSGTVSFVEANTVLGSAPTGQVGTTADALASLRIGLAAGSHRSITAVYHPDAAAEAWYTEAASVTTTSVEVVEVVAPTSLVVATSLNPSPESQPLIVTATVNHPSSTLTPTGSVSFSLNGADLASGVLDSLGQASLRLPALQTGTQTITAAYAGDRQFAPAQGSAAETVIAPLPPPTTPTPSPAATPGPTPSSAPSPSATPPPGSAAPTPSPASGPATAARTTTRPPAAPGPPAQAAPPARPSGSSGTAPLSPDQLDTSAVPPIDLISLVSGIHMGNAPQIVVFLLIVNLVLVGAILVASRRGRSLTRRSLRWGAQTVTPAPGDAAQKTGDSR